MNEEQDVVLVTGAATGIGLAIAEAFARNGAHLILNDINRIPLLQAVRDFTEKGYSTRGCIADLRDKKQVITMFKYLQSEYRALNVLINNAGGGLHTPTSLENIKEEDWDLVVDTNLKGTFLCCQAAISWMKTAKTPGRIVNISSIAGRTGTGSFTSVAYAAAKGGIIALTRKLAKETGSLGIRINCIAPGLVLSGERLREMWENLSFHQQQDMLREIPLGRFSTVEDQVQAILFLTSPQASYLTGVILDVNGGRFMG